MLQTLSLTPAPDVPRPAKRPRRTAPKAPPMTAAQAKSFARISLGSALQVAEQLECTCEPYVSVFTFGRWKAQGFHVRKGEKAKRLATWVAAEGKADAESDEATPFLLPRNVPVFCRCQVEVNEPKD